MTEVNPLLIKEVQSLLGKYIKKPPLSDKLLQKPPFRYLHDLISSIIRETGFLNGLYTEKELNSNNVKEKDAKLKFLDKLISAVKTITGNDVSARSTKIIAGLEVNKTLQLLVIIGKALDNQVVNETKKEPVKEKQNDTKEKGSNKPNLKRKDSETSKNSDLNSYKDSALVTPSKSTHKLEIKNQEKSKSNNEVTKEDIANTKSSIRKSITSSKNDSSSRRGSTQSKLPTRKPSIDKTNQKTSSPKNRQSAIKEEISTASKVEEQSNETLTKKSSDINETNLINQTSFDENRIEKSDQERKFEKNIENDSRETNVNSDSKENLDSNKKEVPIQRPGSARPGSRRSIHGKSLEHEHENFSVKDQSLEKKSEEPKNDPLISVRPKTATRPPSARPGAPRIRDRGEVVITDETKTPPSSVNVIEEGKPDLSDDKDAFIVIESESSLPEEIKGTTPINDQEQGQLVNQILKTQKELNGSVSVDSSENKHSEIEWEAGRQRERDLISSEIDKIRGYIQTLTSAANPLGKLFDFLQEDVDEMQRELLHWKKINENLQKQQITETELRKIFLQPLQKQLEDIENSIQEEFVQIGNIKNTILLNDEKMIK